MRIKKCFSFKGRINRKKYLIYQLIINIAYVITSVYKPDNSILNLLMGILMLTLTFIVFTKTIQRLHDINTSGIIIIIPTILLITSELTKIDIFALIAFGFHCHLLITKGTYGPNKYGDDPLNSTTEYVTLLNES